MTTTGEQLKSTSSAPDGSTALQHLLAQTGGGSGSTPVFISSMESNANVPAYTADLTEDLEVNAIRDDRNVSLDTQNRTSTLQQEALSSDA